MNHCGSTKGKKDWVDATFEVSKSFNYKISNYCNMILLSCAYAGTGNVLKVQHFLGQCEKHLDKGETYQGPAVIGIAMVAMEEELGIEMAIRSVEHLLQYSEQNIRRAVPLALGLLCISNPKVSVMDTLSRLSHDADTEVAMIRMLLTVDKNLKLLSVPVRVGQAVDVVGQAGRAKTIIGFQSHLTSVLLAAGDKAELATEKYIPLSPFLEGFVILRENPDYKEEN